MCPIHHKIIDDDPDRFPVAFLQQLKAAHEAAGVVAEPSDVVARTLLSNSGFLGDISQSSSDDGINVAAAASTVIVNTGLTYREARDIALDVYRSNAIQLRGIAQETARLRAEELTTEFLERLRLKSTNPPESLGDPDMQHVLFEAQRHAARSGDKDLSAILVDLLVERGASTQKGLLEIVLGEAVETAGRLTKEQFDALSLVFVLKYTRRLDVKSVAQLGWYLHEVISRCLRDAARSRASFQHMEYAGCGSLGIGSQALVGLLQSVYAHCFVTSLDRTEFESVVRVPTEVTEMLLQTGHFRSTRPF